MSDTIGISGDRIRSFIERIEHIDEEIKGLTEGKKEAFAEAKGEGFDVKVPREILRLRKLDREDREEHESLVDLYLRAMESGSTPDTRAAARRTRERRKAAGREGWPLSQKLPPHIGAVGGPSASLYFH